MIDEDDFSEIRPYNDQELQARLEFLKKEPRLLEAMNWLYADIAQEDVEEMLDEVKSVKDFQEMISGPAFKVVAQLTTSGLTFTNMDSIEKDQSYLFLSNHRDIILDSALLNVSLLEKGFQTTQIAIGDNLLRNPLIREVVRMNKNFIVNRDVNPREMLMHSKRLSKYIRKTIKEDNTGIWIAHKEGRSKDGDDRTHSGLLKMLALSGSKDLTENLRELNIIPTVVSYEYDPCDLFKANELLALEENGEYIKSEDEDFRSMMKGVTGHKGRVNIALGSALNRRIEAIKDIDGKNDQIKFLTATIDAEMHSIYRLWPTNYIAYDILHGTREYKEHYNNMQRVAFRNYIRSRVIKLMVSNKMIKLQTDGFRKKAREILLRMYANPVVNKQQADRDLLQ